MGLSNSKAKTKLMQLEVNLNGKNLSEKQKTVKSDSDSESDDEFKSFRKCGLTHPPSKCFAYGKVSFKCAKKNHFPIMCGKHAKKGHAKFTKRSVAEMELTDDNTLDISNIIKRVASCE